jgi:serine/threonine protein kinase
MQCNDQRLRSLLQQDAECETDVELVTHVDACPRCQMRMTELAGDANWWRAATESLQTPREPIPPGLSSPSSSIVIAIDRSLADDLPVVGEPVSLDFLAPPSHPEMLGRLDRYEIESVIGAGGMGIVFKGFDTELHRPVAIKVLSPHLAGSGAARSRFAREAQAAAAIVHDHVIPIHNVAVTSTRKQSTAVNPGDSSEFQLKSLAEGGLPYLVMPYIAGESLQARVDRLGALPIKEVVRIALQSAQGLAAAHAQGIIHRDVKPANILLEEQVDRVRISDFGLARAADDASITRSGIIAGTPQYMSPEQTRGEAIDLRSDLFSLGSVIYTLCTGRPPFRAETTMGIRRRNSDSEPRPIRELNNDVPEWLELLVERLMAKSPGRRWASAAELATLLESCLAHLHHPQEHPLPATLVTVTHRARRKRIWFRAACLTTLLITGVALWQGVKQLRNESAQILGSAVNDAQATSPVWNDGVEEELLDVERMIVELERELE